MGSCLPRGGPIQLVLGGQQRGTDDRAGLRCQARLDGLHHRGGADVAERVGREVAHVFVAVGKRRQQRAVSASAGAMTPRASAASLRTRAL